MKDISNRIRNRKGQLASFVDAPTGVVVSGTSKVKPVKPVEPKEGEAK